MARGSAAGATPKEKLLQVVAGVQSAPAIVINVNVTVALNKTPKPAAVVAYVRRLREELAAEETAKAEVTA